MDSNTPYQNESLLSDPALCTNLDKICKARRKIFFITGNTGKLQEAQSIISDIEGKEIDLLEIQEADSRKIIEAKLMEARKHHEGEFIIEDTSLYFDCLNGLPGPLIKWFLEKLGDNGLYELTNKYKNNNAEAKTIIGYSDSTGSVEFFEGCIKGKIVSPTGNNGFGWDRIFQPEGYAVTFAEMSQHEKNNISMRKAALQKFNQFLLESKNCK